MVAPTTKRQKGVRCLQIVFRFRKLRDREVAPKRNNGNVTSLRSESLAAICKSSLKRGISPMTTKPMITSKRDDMVINIENLTVK